MSEWSWLYGNQTPDPPPKLVNGKPESEWSWLFKNADAAPPKPEDFGAVKQVRPEDFGAVPIKQPLGSPAGEAAASLFSGAAAAPLSGWAGIAGAILPGPQGQGADWANRTQNALTYQPRTPLGQKTADVFSYPAQKIADLSNRAGGAVTDAAGPLAGTATNVGLQALPMALSRIAKPFVDAKNSGLTASAERNSVKDTTWANARNEGLVVPPSAIDPSFLTNRLESIGGKAALNQQASIRNQSIFDNIARREASLTPDSPLSESALSDARYDLSQPYRDVASLSPVASKALEMLKEARSESKSYWKHYGVSADPKSLAEAQRLDAKASTLESRIEAEAQAKGSPDLVDQLRQARTDIAKNYTVDRALNLGSGEVDAGVIGRMLDKGSPMTGGLETIGQFQQAFGRYAKPGSNVPAAGVSKSEALASVLLGATGMATGIGPWAAALPLMSGPVRSLLLSDLMQKQRAYQPGVGLLGVNAFTQNPPTMSLLPAVGLRNNQ